jgi:hypothetical protein
MTTIADLARMSNEGFNNTATKEDSHRVEVWRDGIE